MTAIETRYGEHLTDIKYGRGDKSSVAHYVLIFVERRVH